MEIEAEIDRRLREIRVRARASEAADKVDPTFPPVGAGGVRATRGEAALDLARTYGLDYHLGTAVERILEGAAEGARGRRSLEEACRLIERYMALVEQSSGRADLKAIPTGRAEELSVPTAAPARGRDVQSQRPELSPVPEPDQEGAASAPAPQSVPHQLALMALHFFIVAAVTIAAIALFALIVELR